MFLLYVAEILDIYSHCANTLLPTHTINVSLTPPLLTMSMQKSGRCPVMPNTVVLRYFSWPARSMKVMTFEDFSQILVQSRPPPWLSGLFTTWKRSRSRRREWRMTEKWKPDKTLKKRRKDSARPWKDDFIYLKHIHTVMRDVQIRCHGLSFHNYIIFWGIYKISLLCRKN